MLKKFELCLDDYIYELEDEPNLSQITDYFKNESFEIVDLEDFTNSLKIISIIATVKNHFNRLKENFNEKDLTLIASYGDNENKYRISDNIKSYINRNLKKIFETESPILITKTLNLICEYGTSENNFEYIVNDFMIEKQEFLFHNYKDFYKALGKYSKKLKSSYVKNLLIPINIYHLDCQIEISGTYKDTFEEIQVEFENELLETLKSESFNNQPIFLKKRISNNIIKSKINKDTKFKLEELHNSINLSLKEEINKHGIHRKEEIDIKDYINFVENTTNIREQMFFIDYGNYKNGYISTYSYISKIKDPIFLQLITNLSNTTNHSYMFNLYMNRLRIQNFLKVNYLIYKHKHLFWSELSNLYNSVLKRLNIKQNRDFVEKFKGLFSMKYYKECSDKVVMEIEYLLRCIYINKEFGVNISGSNNIHIGLSDSLDEKALSDLFSIEDVKCLKYILIEKNCFNYRNSLAHNMMDEVLIEDSLYLLSVFIFILISFNAPKV